VGRNAAIKRFSASHAGQPLDLFEAKRQRVPVVLELLASPWVARASDLSRADGSGAAKHAEEPVEVEWDGERRIPVSFTRAGRVHRTDAVVQTWVTERAWWDPRKRVSRRFWRVQSGNGVYDLAFDRKLGIWLLTGIQD
jgi:hypothetical protein